ncbi:hypothetical protein CANARDRAFT_7458 [[Candida] arabinofermentans NRRL YB-2248]|uniref:DNA-binding protein RAP1 n=1 Tax=[Candida] arabinofermentans NRRL YB-2248 TaxID=983967 RepID=A0A1E4T304_9ASCO|nr:hypothetical protein CANARDRAFT_7458 [[Candida] arabinofermentans NRRL YB-2248]
MSSDSLAIENNSSSTVLEPAIDASNAAEAAAAAVAALEAKEQSEASKDSNGKASSSSTSSTTPPIDESVVDPDLPKDEITTKSNGDDENKLTDPSTTISELLKGTKYYIISNTFAKKDITKLIKVLGGEVSDVLSDDSYLLVRSASDIPLDKEVDAYSFNYIYAVHSNKILPDIEEYKLRKPPQLPSHLKINVGDLASSEPDSDKSLSISDEISSKPPTKVSKTRNSKTNTTNAHPLLPPAEYLAATPKKRSSKFTPQEDEAILDLIRRNPNLRSTHSFYARIAQLPLLSSHTGNSIRFRFRKILQPRLEYVYQLDPETNEVMINSETGKPIIIKDLPELLKSQYTAEEDYELCKHIRYFKDHSEDFLKKRKGSENIPESVFLRLVEKSPRHTAMSWRDRYRKFASRYGIDEYCKYYEDCLAQNIEPVPMKNLSSRSKEATEARASKKSKISNNVSKSSSFIEDFDNESDKKSTNLERIEALARVSVERKETLDNETTTTTTTTSVDNEKVALKKVEEGKKDDGSDGANLFADANEEEIKALNENLPELPPLEQEQEQEHEHEPVTEVEAEPVTDAILSFEELKRDEPEPIKDKSELNIEKTCNEIESIVSNFGSNLTTSFDLFKVISEESGLSLRWLNYWFDCSCGHLTVFMDAILNYIRNDELILKDYSGFWTDEHDMMLKNDDKLNELIELHGFESVQKRKEALFGVD